MRRVALLGGRRNDDREWYAVYILVGVIVVALTVLFIIIPERPVAEPGASAPVFFAVATPEPTPERCIVEATPGVTSHEPLLQPSVSPVGAFHPVATIQAAYRSLLDGDREDAERLADELVAHSELIDGARLFPYTFDWDLGQATGHMRAPWYSGMAQGLALGLFARLGRPETEEIYRSLDDLTRDGWIEEYPLPEPNPVLNGHIWAVFGLYDYWTMTGAGQERLEAAMQVALDNLHRFGEDLEWYDLRHMNRNPGYQEVHHQQVPVLREMAAC